MRLSLNVGARRPRSGTVYRRSALAVAALGMLPLALVATAGPAAATYPGGEGRLAFGMTDPTGNVDIYTVRADGHGLRRLTTGRNFDACAAYSPTGNRIAYCSGVIGDSLEIWVMRRHGRHAEQLTHLGGWATFPDFSPDGRRVAFSEAPASGRPARIATVNASGDGLTWLTTGPSDNEYPAWSPDGTRIAFITDRTGSHQVFVMASDGSGAVQLTHDGREHGQLPDWSPDGQSIAYQTSTPDGGRIWVMSADGSGAHELVSAPAGTEDFGAAWSPDGTRVAFVRTVPGSQRAVWVVNADGSNAHPVHPDGPQFVPGWQSKA
jgi:Tol biopolymer transport system component